jgi:hypothetical protein
MHVPINVKSPNNISKWQMGFNSAFKGLILLRMNKIRMWSIGGMELTEGNRIAQRKLCSTAILTTTDSKQAGLKLNPGVRDGWSDPTT